MLKDLRRMLNEKNIEVKVLKEAIAKLEQNTQQKTLTQEELNLIKSRKNNKDSVSIRYDAKTNSIYSTFNGKGKGHISFLDTIDSVSEKIMNFYDTNKYAVSVMIADFENGLYSDYGRRLQDKLNEENKKRKQQKGK